jgi:hypothetical protein
LRLWEIAVSQLVGRCEGGVALSLRQVLLAAFLLYATGLPILLWLHAGYEPVARPAGRQTELLLKFRLDRDGTYSAQTFAFAKLRDDEPLLVYENLARLDAGRYSTYRIGEARRVKLTAPDGTDPNSNGRRYWAVRP